MKIITGKDDYQREITIELPEHKSRVGVMLSGGADSAILLYLLCLERKMGNLPHEIIPYTVPRGDGAWNYVYDIVSYIRNALDCELPDSIQVGDPNLHHSKQGRSGELAARELGMEHFYYGSQMTPPPEFPMPGDYPARPDKLEYDIGISCPFALCDKRNTIDLYSAFDQWDLLALTHSCTAQTEGRCGECFNCTERKWALNAGNFTDPGSK